MIKNVKNKTTTYFYEQNFKVEKFDVKKDKSIKQINITKNKQKQDINKKY